MATEPTDGEAMDPGLARELLLIREQMAQLTEAVERGLQEVGLTLDPLPPRWDTPLPLDREESIALDTLRRLVERGVIRPA